jgi:hypothetical protein
MEVSVQLHASAALLPVKKGHCIRWLEDWVGPRARLAMVPLLEIEPWLLIIVDTPTDFFLTVIVFSLKLT